MQLEIHEFGGHPIEFEFVNGNLMANATEMAKVFSKQTNEFLSNKQTNNFIDHCIKNGNSRFLGVEKKEDLVVSSQKSGTWMHEVLAYKFAAWLDPAFELWVYMTIRRILHQRYQELEGMLKSSAQRQDRIDDLTNKLYANDENFRELLELQTEQRQAAYRRGQKIRSQIEFFKQKN